MLKYIIAIKEILEAQSLNQKEILTFKEASKYLNLTESYLYKLTSQKKITFSQPNNKKIYFKRTDLDAWMLQNRKLSEHDIHKEADEYFNLVQNGNL